MVTDSKIGAVARTSAEKKKAEDLKKSKKGIHSLFESKAFRFNLGITVFFSIIFCWLLFMVQQDGEVNSFDPFGILEIDPGADSKAIKRAFRTLSLKYHPDKNPGDRAAEAKFMMVAKAYETLTDETAKENYEKYGNPDGKQSLEVSIGLPSFLLETNNRNLVLMVYLVFMVGVIPFAVWTYYSDSSKYGEKDVMYDSYSWFHHTLNEHTQVRNLPEILAGSAEFRKCNVPRDAQDKKEVATALKGLKSTMLKPKYNHPVCVKGNVLVHEHLLRQAVADIHVDDLKNMLSYSTALCDAMISVCKHQDSMQTAANCIEFGQYMTQGMWTKDSPLYQLPHFDANQVKLVQSGKAKVNSVKDYRDLPEDQRKGFSNMTAEQKKDISSFLKIYPDMTVETRVFVDDDEDDNVYDGDLVTIQVTITRNNLETGQKVGLVHAPRFPFPKKEALWVILGQMKEGKIISIEKVTNPNKVVKHNIKFLAPPPGTYNFDLLIKSNAYVGVDEVVPVAMTTLDSSTLPEYKVHPDDAELDDEPTLFEEMLNAHIDQDDSDDDDSDDEDNEDDEDDGKKTQRRARQQADDDDDSDSDAEEVYADK